MKPTTSEHTNLFWNCRIAAMLVDDLEETTARNGIFAHAVRRATECHVGAKGVQYASQAALDAAGPNREWKNKGLVKEHIVPLSEIARFVRQALANPPPVGIDAGLSELDGAGYPPAVVALFREHPRAWQVARVVRAWTSMAWITRQENERFADKDLHNGKTITKCMPAGWQPGMSHFMRYDACKIPLVALF